MCDVEGVSSPQATLLWGSWAMHESRMASDTWSHILSVRKGEGREARGTKGEAGGWDGERREEGWKERERKREGRCSFKPELKRAAER